MELNSASVKERDGALSVCLLFIFNLPCDLVTELRSRLSSLQHEFDSLRAEMEHLRESFKKSQACRFVVSVL